MWKSTDPVPATQKGAPRRALGGPMALLQAVFVDQVKVRRDGGQIKLVLETGARPPTSQDSAPAPASTPASPSGRMHAELRALLDGQAGSRRVLKHLAALEQLLARPHSASELGLRLHELSLPVLGRMSRQLDGLLVPPASAGLAALQAGLLDAMESQTHLERQATQAQAAAPISSFFVDHKLQVSDASDTDFLQAFGEPAAPRPA